MAIIIEVLNKQHRVIERHKFHHAVISLGRAFSNDVILSDPHICPQHAQLRQTADGTWQLHDLSSLNGSFLQQAQPLQQPANVQSGQTCWLGEQLIRIYDEQQPVAPTIPFNVWEQRLLKFGQWPLLLLLVCCIVLEHLRHTWLLAPNQQQGEWTRQLLNLPMLLIAFCLWPSLLALWAKLNQHEARLLPQIGLTFAGILAIALWQLVMGIARFSFDGSDLVLWLEEGGQALLLTLLLLANFILASQWSRWKQTLLATAIAVLISAQNMGVAQFFDETRLLQPQFDASLQPSQLYLNQPASLEEFQLQSATLFEQAAKQRQQPEP